VFEDNTSVTSVQAGDDAALARLVDPSLPALPVLLREPSGLLGAAVAPAGGTVRSAKPRQATWRPGSSLTVRYDVAVKWPDGQVTQEMIVAMTGRIHPQSLVLESGDARVAVWRVPNDPWLPALAPATNLHRLDALLDSLDVPKGRVEHRFVAYRPGRRAVVRVRRAHTTLYLKAVPPGRADPLHKRHAALSKALPVPRSLGVDRALGLVVLQALEGAVLRQRLEVDGAALPSPEAVLALLDRLPAPADGARAPGWGAHDWAELLGRMRPERAEAVHTLADEISRVTAVRPAPLVPVHGDLHEAQLLVKGDRISGLLDVDTHGLGHRTDDLANLIGHLSALSLGRPDNSQIDRYAARLLSAFEQTVDPVALRNCVAEVVLGLATGPFRVLEQGWPTKTDERITLAERWADSARRLAGMGPAPSLTLSPRRMSSRRPAFTAPMTYERITARKE
jgi:phosphotransferase family enzyme